jgi:gluconokinase
LAQQGQSGILTCSALKETYREHLTAGLPEARFIWLDPPRSVLKSAWRIAPATSCPPALLDSQLATLEPPTDVLPPHPPPRRSAS